MPQAQRMDFGDVELLHSIRRAILKEDDQAILIRIKSEDQFYLH